MRTVISARDIEDLLRKGTDLSTALPPDALLTPSARDLLREHGGSAPVPSVQGAARDGKREGAPSVTPSTGNGKAPALPGSGYRKVAPGEIERFFNASEINALKAEICDIGRRMWSREYVDGNGGNISIRVAEDLVLCTPTLVSKGFMKPEDLCFVDLEGVQKAGVKPRTSEILMHLAIFKAQPKARACVHAHPPHATGFAVSGVQPPNCMIPEMEIMCGEVPIAPYMTPGSKAMGEAVAALSGTHNTILMANHGVVAWGFGIEDAYFKMEILEAYCRTVLVSAQLGKDPNLIPARQVQELLRIKKGLGIPDRRTDLKECELCDASEWRPGVTCNPRPKSEEGALDEDAEVLVRRVTDEILRALSK